MTFFGWIPLFVAKSCLISGLGAMAYFLIRRHSAARRHWALVTTMFGLLLVPAMLLAPPSWRLPISSLFVITDESIELTSMQPQDAATDVTVLSQSDEIDGIGFTATDDATLPAVPAEDAVDATIVKGHENASEPIIRLSQFGSIVGLVWSVGVIAVVLVPVVGLFAIYRLSRLSKNVTDADWQSQLDRLRVEMGIRRAIQLRKSDSLPTAITWGLIRPTIILPTSADQWSSRRRQIVLQHELAHIRRHDWGIQMLGSLCLALHWFNPIAWWGHRLMQVVREQACDDLVLMSGVESTHYAEVLFLSAAEAHPCHTFAAIPMAHSSRLEQRMHSILDKNQRREPTSHRAMAAMMAICGLIVFPLALVGTAGADAPAASQPPAADKPATDQETSLTARFEVNVIEADGALANDVEVSGTAVGRRGKRQVGLFRRSGEIWELGGLLAGERVVVTVRRGDWSVSSKPSQPVNVEAGAPTDRMEFRLPPMTVASAKPREGVYFGYTGYMTYVIEIRKGQFRYWFESDAKSRREPTYPLEGKYSIDGDTITLHHKELISLTSIWKCRSVNGIPTLWRHDAIEHHENEPLELSVEHLRRWGSGSILARTTRSGEVMWNERTAPGLTAPYRPARKRPDFHVQISLLVDGEAFDEKKLLSESVISSVVKDKALNGLTAGSKEGWLRSRLHVERIRKSNLVVVSMARETDRDDTDSFESILNVVAREIIAQAGPDARVQIVSSPTLSSTCQTSPDGTVEYVWSIKGAIGGDRLLSKIELIRNRRDNPLIRGYERSTWSKAKSMHERKLTMSVHPPVNGKEKTIEFTGADTRKILIPDSASVSVTTHQVRREEQVRHVINITVSNNGLILNHHVFVVWLSHPSQLVHYDGLLEQVHDHQDKGDSITWLTYGGFLPPDNAERCFRRYAALDK